MYIVSTKLSKQIHLEDQIDKKDDKKYKRFWKQLCPFGEWVDPNDWDNSKLVIDENLVDQMIKNFEDKVGGMAVIGRKMGAGFLGGLGVPLLG